MVSLQNNLILQAILYLTDVRISVFLLTFNIEYANIFKCPYLRAISVKVE